MHKIRLSIILLLVLNGMALSGAPEVSKNSSQEALFTYSLKSGNSTLQIPYPEHFYHSPPSGPSAAETMFSGDFGFVLTVDGALDTFNQELFDVLKIGHITNGQAGRWGEHGKIINYQVDYQSDELLVTSFDGNMPTGRLRMCHAYLLLDPHVVALRGYRLPNYPDDHVQTISNVIKWANKIREFYLSPRKVLAPTEGGRSEIEVTLGEKQLVIPPPRRAKLFKKDEPKGQFKVQYAVGLTQAETNQPGYLFLFNVFDVDKRASDVMDILHDQYKILVARKYLRDVERTRNELFIVHQVEYVKEIMAMKSFTAELIFPASEHLLCIGISIYSMEPVANDTLKNELSSWRDGILFANNPNKN